ncbi:MAG: asparagine synthase [Planctomycetota bacterium]|nr:MAG: asparagine synthase [Planctomycetota bacterium]
MVSADGRRALAYNGELYNFRELREELRAGGVAFQTAGDAEVVLEALTKWGAAALPRFNGMFALALWDEDAGRLLLARDRFGQKPLYLVKHGGEIAFASELRALLEAGVADRRIDAEALAGFLLYGSVPGPGTIVQGVELLGAGTALSWSAGSVTPSRYVPARSRERRELSADALREELRQAVTRHLISDVPTGVFLSGGLDSASIAVLAACSSVVPVQTLTLSFPDVPAQDEAREARETAAHVGTHHTEIAVSADAIRGGLEEAIRSLDQPSGDGLNTWLVARAAKSAGLTVALSGIGADELFGGYTTFVDVPRMARLRSVAGPASGFIAGAASMVRAADPRRISRISDFMGAPSGLLPAYLARRRMRSSAQVRDLAPGLGGKGWMQGISEARRAGLDAAIRGCAPEDAVALLELDLYMGDTLLRDADCMGMAHSLEIRAPFLDGPLADAVLGLDARRRRPVPVPKPLLLEAVGPLLPPGLKSRPKRGFTLPLATWMRGLLRKEVADGLERLDVQGSPISMPAVRALWKDFLDRTDAVGWYLPWTLYVLGHYLAANRLRFA